MVYYWFIDGLFLFVLSALDLCWDAAFLLTFLLSSVMAAGLKFATLDVVLSFSDYQVDIRTL